MRVHRNILWKLMSILKRFKIKRTEFYKELVSNGKKVVDAQPLGIRATMKKLSEYRQSHH